jgi:hypothetical protein
VTAARTMIVEERLSRIEALTLALDCVAARGGELNGTLLANTCGFLRIMVHEELESLTAGLGADVLNTST